jgi:glyoxylase-like metal-dependent hydrolase (beta-lactamase superfamily II)
VTPVVEVDTRHDGRAGAIAAYVVPGPEPVLVDPGPTPVIPRLEEALNEVGLPLGEIRHVVLTHVHLDHAGATGHLVRKYPRIQVHVHEEGAPHLADPERLIASTRRTFEEDHDRLWGEVVPVPADRLRAWRPGEGRGAAGLRGVPTPGHIGHHMAWLDERDGLLFAGDSLGILLGPHAPVHPPTPPPAIDLRAWFDSLAEIATVGPDHAAVTHFGVHTGVGARASELREALLALAIRVEEALSEGRTDEDAQAFDQESRDRLAETLPRERIDGYLDVFSAVNDYRGVQRYVERHPGWKDGL